MPHFLDSVECRVILARDTLNDKPLPAGLLAKTAGCHGPVGERKSRCHVKAERRVRRWRLHPKRA
jgi:hypothetical protein